MKQVREPGGSSFGSVLRFFRRREKLTQREVAKKLEVHENSVSLWEREEGLPESHTVVSKMAELFHYDALLREMGRQDEAGCIEAPLPEQATPQDE